MTDERLIKVVDGSRKLGTCKFCGRPVEWATTPKGKNLPLQPNAIRLHVDVNTETRVRFEVFPASAVHIPRCPYWPKKSTPNHSVARAWAGGRR